MHEAHSQAGILISCILHRWHFSLFKASFWGCGEHIERRHALSPNKVHLNYACSDYRHCILVCMCMCVCISVFHTHLPNCDCTLRDMCPCPVCEHLHYTFVCLCMHMLVCRWLAPLCVQLHTLNTLSPCKFLQVHEFRSTSLTEPCNKIQYYPPTRRIISKQSNSIMAQYVACVKKKKKAWESQPTFAKPIQCEQMRCSVS